MDAFFNEIDRTYALGLTKDLLFYEGTDFDIDFPITMCDDVHCASTRWT
jgi:hypothetical protein